MTKGEQVTNQLQVVVFQLLEEEYGLDILAVQEIKEMLEITRVPHAPSFIRGVVNLRGNIVPVVDLNHRFGMPPSTITDDTRIVVVNGGDMVLGLIVDKVLEVVSLPDQALAAPPRMATTCSQNFLAGVGRYQERLLLILDLEQVVAVDGATVQEGLV